MLQHFEQVHQDIGSFQKRSFEETFCHLEGKQGGLTSDNSKILKGIQRGQEVGNLQFPHGEGVEVFWNDP
jgi:hypothetical protein